MDAAVSCPAPRRYKYCCESGNFRKIALLFRNNSAEKFRTFLADNFIKLHKKCLVSELLLFRKTFTTTLVSMVMVASSQLARFFN